MRVSFFYATISIMSKEIHSEKPIVGIGTTFDVSGHKAKVVAITKEGIQVTIPNVTNDSHPMIVDFKEIEKAVFGK